MAAFGHGNNTHFDFVALSCDTTHHRLYTCMSEKTVGFILILSSAAMGACIVPLAKIASSVVPPLSIVFWRVFPASIIFIPIAYKNKEKISIH